MGNETHAKLKILSSLGWTPVTLMSVQRKKRLFCTIWSGPWDIEQTS